jgi:hypothetical protein
MDERMSSTLPAVIRTDDSAIPCMVLNLSAGGAKLLTEAKDELPNEFILFLRPNSPIGRRCHVIWQLGNKVAVRFLSVDLDKPPGQGSGVWAPS